MPRLPQLFMMTAGPSGSCVEDACVCVCARGLTSVLAKDQLGHPAWQQVILSHADALTGARVTFTHAP